VVDARAAAEHEDGRNEADDPPILLESPLVASPVLASPPPPSTGATPLTVTVTSAVTWPHVARTVAVPSWTPVTAMAPNCCALGTVTISCPDVTDHVQPSRPAIDVPTESFGWTQTAWLEPACTCTVGELGVRLTTSTNSTWTKSSTVEVPVCVASKASYPARCATTVLPMESASCGEADVMS
jgi:hypothetical protein